MDRQEIINLLMYLENNPGHQSSLQHAFVSTLKKHYNITGVLTKRQVESLYDIKELIRNYFTEEAFNESETNKYQAQYSSIDYLTTFRI